MKRIRPVFLLATLVVLFAPFYQLLGTVLPLFAASGPTTTATISAQSQQGSNGWYVTGVTVLLSATGSANIQSITFWLDNSSPFTVNANNTTQTFSQNGSHTLSFYARDVNGVQESPTKSITFKIDTVSPVNWTNVTQTRNGNDHTFQFSATVTDTTSGLDPAQAYMQYDVSDDDNSDNGGTNWGYYSNLGSCNSNWNANQWYHLPAQSFAAGASSGTITTPAVNYCNSSGSGCDFMKVRIFDIAGNYADRKICLGAPWFQTQTGDIYSQPAISMGADAPQPNASGIVSSGSTISSFSTSTNQYIQNYSTNMSIGQADYAMFYPTVSSKTVSLPNGKLGTTTGYYFYNGNLSITSAILPASYSTVKNVATVVFINGTLTINTNITTDPTMVTMFVVSGDINIDKSVTKLSGIYVTDGQLDTSYNGTSSNQLVINGMTYARGFAFSRSLGATTNKTTPAEQFVFQPNYVTNTSLTQLIVGSALYNWSEVSP